MPTDPLAAPAHEPSAEAVITELKTALLGWLTANAPGGWIDDLRQQASSLPEGRTPSCTSPGDDGPGTPMNPLAAAENLKDSERTNPGCFSCHGSLTGLVVWLGETYDGIEKEWPFHESCANQPWPLYETRREVRP